MRIKAFGYIKELLYIYMISSLYMSYHTWEHDTCPRHLGTYRGCTHEASYKTQQKAWPKWSIGKCPRTEDTLELNEFL